MSEIAKYEMIDLYLEGGLGAEEMVAFRHKMQVDAAFAAEVEAQQLANELVVGCRLNQVKQMMDDDFASGKVKANGGNHLKWWLGGILVVTLTGAWWYTSTKNVQTQHAASELFDERKSGSKNGSGNVTPQNQAIDLSYKKPVTQESVKRQTSETTIAEQDSNNITGSEPLSERTILQSIPAPASDEPSSKTETSLATAPANCSSKSADAFFDITSTCHGKAEGKVLLRDVKVRGGKAPYRFALVSNENKMSPENIDFQQSMILDHNSSGKYMLWVEDSEGCRMPVRKDIFIEETVCAQAPSSFSPAYNEVFHFPVNENTDGAMVIKDKGGNLVYSVEVKGGQPSEWDGTNMHGGVCGPGVYIYIIEYKDGKKLPGQVVIY